MLKQTMLHRPIFVLLFVDVLLALLLAFATLALAPLPACDIGSGQDLLCARGFETRERGYGERFRWSNEFAAIHLFSPGSGVPLVLDMRLRSGRPAGSPPVAARFGLNGYPLVDVAVPPTNRRYQILLPSLPPTGDVAKVQIVSETWKPNVLSRTFGLVLLHARLMPTTGIRVPGALLVLSWLAVLLTVRVVTFSLLPNLLVTPYNAGSAGGSPASARAGVWHRQTPTVPFSKESAWLPFVWHVLPLWGLLVGLVLLLLMQWLPLLPLLPWIAVLFAAGVLAWRWWVLPATDGVAAAPLLWAIACVLPYLLVIVAEPAVWLRAGLLLASGGLAVVAAGNWWHLPSVGNIRAGVTAKAQRAQRPGQEEAIPYRRETKSGVRAFPAWEQMRSPLVQLLLSAALLRLLLLAARLLSGNTRLDADVELFYAYGMALREVGLPEVEYPSGALLPWAALSWLSGDSREAFALLLPLLNIGCDLLIVAALTVIGWSMLHNDAAYRKTDRAQKPFSILHSPFSILVPAAFYAFSPLLEPFVFAKYDGLPTMLAVGALALFAVGRAGWAGFALGLGTTIKWTPLLAMPFLLLHLLRQQRWWASGGLLGMFLLAVALCSVPFALADMQTFLLPYQIQGGRDMTGESFWALVALLLDPSLIDAIEAPWGILRRGGLPVPLMLGGQVVALGALGTIALLRPPALGRTLALAALAPALFLLLNRIFSPQYLLPISAGVLAAVAATCLFTRSPGRAWLRAKAQRRKGPGSCSRKGAKTQRARQEKGGRGLPAAHPYGGVWALPMETALSLILLAVAQVCNLLIWPFFVEGFWLAASGVLFGGTCIGILLVTKRSMQQ